MSNPEEYLIGRPGLWWRCWQRVAAFVDVADLVSLRGCCKTLREIADDDEVWAVRSTATPANSQNNNNDNEQLVKALHKFVSQSPCPFTNDSFLMFVALRVAKTYPGAAGVLLVNDSTLHHRAFTNAVELARQGAAKQREPIRRLDRRSHSFVYEPRRLDLCDKTARRFMDQHVDEMESQLSWINVREHVLRSALMCAATVVALQALRQFLSSATVGESPASARGVLLEHMDKFPIKGKLPAAVSPTAQQILSVLLGVGWVCVEFVGNFKFSTRSSAFDPHSHCRNDRSRLSMRALAPLLASHVSTMCHHYTANSTAKLVGLIALPVAVVWHMLIGAGVRGVSAATGGFLFANASAATHPLVPSEIVHGGSGFSALSLEPLAIVTMSVFVMLTHTTYNSRFIQPLLSQQQQQAAVAHPFRGGSAYTYDQDGGIACLDDPTDAISLLCEVADAFMFMSLQRTFDDTQKLVVAEAGYTSSTMFATLRPVLISTVVVCARVVVSKLGLWWKARWIKKNQ